MLRRGGAPGESGAAADTAKLIIATDSDQAAFGYDPIRYGSGQRMFFEGIYDSLFVLDQDGKVVPHLVTKFEYSEDQTELTLDLDTSATFADGTTLSAELVKQNLDSRGDPDLQRLLGVRDRGAERDHRRRRRRRGHCHPPVRRSPSPGSSPTSSRPPG